MLKRHFFLVAAAGVLALMVLAVVLRMAFAGDGESGGGGPGGPGGRAQLVSVTTASERAFSDPISVLGVARGRRSVDITSATTELITRVMFADGQTVGAGAALVELQADEEDADIIQARAAVAQAQRNYERYAELAERGIAPRVTAELAETELDTARAQLNAAEARRGDRMIRAPFAGVLGLSDVTAGTLINPGTTIATLDDISVIRVDFPVPERFVSLLSPGVPITATADAYPGQTFTGRIALIDTRIDPQTRALTARAEFANPGMRIRPGMMMRVQVEQGRRQAVAVPEAAVQYEGDGAFVYQIARNGEAATAQRMEVQAGAVSDGFVEISSGLDAGDQVVAAGLNRIQPGAAVTVGQPPAAGQTRTAQTAAPQKAAAS
ncbi:MULTISPECIES: efflux RND transporter periplasmic adaptor subunit [Brevundimonas]|uniref:efflux RND transporter periplasmic adaptor subunit n=1 Tax=Brevundimonas TaxID=41275 RepID=UPI000F03644B|nr:efflux RND transporter periplasmic adaptor subunit [Brevundimonas lutea]